MFPLSQSFAVFCSVCTEAYSEHSQTYKIELFADIVIGWQLWTIFAKSSILDIQLGSAYVSDILQNIGKIRLNRNKWILN